MSDLRTRLVSSLTAYSVAGMGVQLSPEVARKLARWIDAAEARIEGARDAEARAEDLLRRADRRLFVGLWALFAGLSSLALSIVIVIAGGVPWA